METITFAILPSISRWQYPLLSFEHATPASGIGFRATNRHGSVTEIFSFCLQLRLGSVRRQRKEQSCCVH